MSDTFNGRYSDTEVIGYPDIFSTLLCEALKVVGVDSGHEDDHVKIQGH